LYTTCTPCIVFLYSWHLWCVLNALEYEHLSEYMRCSLCCSYASQLESLGLWQWAVYVLMHLNNPVQYVFKQMFLLCVFYHFIQIVMPVGLMHCCVASGLVDGGYFTFTWGIPPEMSAYSLLQWVILHRADTASDWTWNSIAMLVTAE
jgi:hypothetical protein